MRSNNDRNRSLWIVLLILWITFGLSMCVTAFLVCRIESKQSELEKRIMLVPGPTD